MYKILEVRILRENNKPAFVMVLVVISEGDIRCVGATDKFTPGYCYIDPEKPITEEVLQEVAGFGRCLPDGHADIWFPGWRERFPNDKILMR